jgi:hypothetical protein
VSLATRDADDVLTGVGAFTYERNGPDKPQRDHRRPRCARRDVDAWRT